MLPKNSSKRCHKWLFWNSFLNILVEIQGETVKRHSAGVGGERDTANCRDRKQLKLHCSQVFTAERQEGLIMQCKAWHLFFIFDNHKCYSLGLQGIWVKISCPHRQKWHIKQRLIIKNVIIITNNSHHYHHRQMALKKIVQQANVNYKSILKMMMMMIIIISIIIQIA